MNAFIFDLDGTLSDSIPVIVATAKESWAELGVAVDEARILSFIGTPLFETGEAVLGPGRGQEYVAMYQKHYRAQPRQLRPFPGVPEMLAALKQQGARLALCTAKHEHSAVESVEQIGVSGLLDVIVHSDMTTLRKPHAEPALRAVELLGADRRDCLFIGDSVHDIRCGHNARLAACAVTYGAGTAEELAAERPEYTAHNIPALRALLLSLLDHR